VKSKSFDKEQKQVLMGPGAINQFVNPLRCEEGLYTDFVSTIAWTKV